MFQPGDLHNFGRRVTHVERASGSFFQKPRSVFWENLFFGETSPLERIFSSGENLGSRASYEDFGKPHFCLELQFTDASEGGLSRAIDSSELLNENRIQAIQRFGWLLAYCYIFGIRDLHRGNLVLTSRGLQPIDAEVVLTKLVLPHETLLLPFKSNSFASSGIGQLFPSPDSISPGDTVNLLRGYFACFEAIIRCRPAILSALNEIVREYSHVPVRHILRDTADYRSWGKESEREFFPEELVQLERGDIPYFFKFIGSPHLYYYSSADGDYSEVNVPARFKPGADREALHPETLLSESRIVYELLPSGALFLARSLLPKSYEGITSIDSGIRLSSGPTTLEIATKFGTWTTSRFRQEHP